MPWDVFICHANEDKYTFVKVLAKKLMEKGLDVWYDDFTLKMGDSLRESTDKGLAESDFGIVVLSPEFFRKEWPQKELNGLVARETKDKKVILPIWHNVTKEDVLKYSPFLVDRKAVRSEEGLDSVVRQIIEVVKPELIETVPPEKQKQISAEARIDGVTSPELYEDTSPVTYENVLKYATEKSKEINWESHIPNIYGVYRNLDIHIMAQLSEAIEDKWAREELKKIYQKLLDREPDWVAIFAFQSWIFILRARGIEIVEQGILASPEYRKKKLNFLRIPIQKADEGKEQNREKNIICLSI